ncbi:uncharacterized protein LOC110010676 [Jatropha curcas]|uniref:uncharacterized protein LOC110010676 n=1 Tax=Jatropha curcas TaxID=180498 RepID=UPI0018955D68|nr:uncharacterized protein LOC110010676 [Jatropha curcas]
MARGRTVILTVRQWFAWTSWPGAIPSSFVRYVWGFVICVSGPVLPPSHPSSGTSRLHPLLSVQYCRHSQPSTPSSSGSLPLLLLSSSGPVQTPPAAHKSPTVCIYPSSRAARQIFEDIKLQAALKKDTHGCRYAQEARDFYWGGVSRNIIWDEAPITAMLKVAWEKICADRYADFTYRMRRSGKKQRCVSQEIWESWQKAWEDPAFKRKREMFAQNRRSETGGDGAGPSRHTGGSISAIETARLLAKELGREPTPIRWELTLLQPEHSDSYCDDDIRAQLADQQRQIAELRAHVIRLSGEHRAGTSPSDPTPATDRHVSTSQQQPLSAPDPDAADDTLVPGATSHPAGTPTRDPTSEDPTSDSCR